METLETLSAMLRRLDLCSKGRALRNDVRDAILTGDTDKVTELVGRAVSLKIMRSGDAIL